MTDEIINTVDQLIFDKIEAIQEHNIIIAYLALTGIDHIASKLDPNAAFICFIRIRRRGNLHGWGATTLLDEKRNTLLNLEDRFFEYTQHFENLSFEKWIYCVNSDMALYKIGSISKIAEQIIRDNGPTIVDSFQYVKARLKQLCQISETKI